MRDYLKISQRDYANLIGRTSKTIKKDFLIYKEQMFDEVLQWIWINEEDVYG